MSTVTLPADKFDTAMVFVRPDDAPNRVPLDKLAVLPGFNTRVKDAEYNERVANIAASIAEHGFYEDKPLAVTMLPGDDTIYIFDGEHRFDASKQATLDGADFPGGVPVAWAKDGATVRDLTLHLLHGNNSERLNMVEMASVVRRLQSIGLEKDEISKEIGRTTRHVDNLFVLADSNATIKKAVASNQIAGAEAVKLIRKHGSKDAATKITEAIKAAAERGKAKATPKSMAAPATGKAADPKRRTKTVTFEHAVEPGTVMGELLKQIAGQVRAQVKFGDDDKVTEDFTVGFKLVVIDHEAEAAAAKAAEDRAAAAAEKQKAREAAAAERAKAKEAKEAEKAAKAKQAEEAKAAQTALLKESVAGAAKATAAKTAVKKGQGPKPLKDALANAKEHLSGGKTDQAVKAPRTRKKAGESDSKAKGTTTAEKAGSAADGAGSPAAAPLSEDSMGGL